MKELRNRDFRKFSPGKQTSTSRGYNSAKNPAPNPKPDHASKKSIKGTRTNCTGHSARAITQEAKSNTKDESSNDIGADRSFNACSWT